jgi:hypothetical protein
VHLGVLHDACVGSTALVSLDTFETCSNGLHGLFDPQEFVSFAIAEGQRNDAGGVIYPGGAFDPLGYAEAWLATRSSLVAAVHSTFAPRAPSLEDHPFLISDRAQLRQGLQQGVRAEAEGDQERPPCDGCLPW